MTYKHEAQQLRYDAIANILDDNLLEAAVEVIELVDLADEEVAVPSGNLKYYQRTAV